MTIPQMFSDRYELTQTLGHGGMSEVHRGRDTRLGREVAVKVLRADLARDPEFQQRFRREAQNAAALNHPAIVAVYDTGEAQTEYGPLPYIVMEYVQGRTLRDLVKTEGPMEQQRAMEVMADVCAAMDFSHRAGIVHRDVKPANVMISATGAVKVMDFGIARALADGQGMTQTAAVIGTAQYLSPEQARGEEVDARSDVYAAGCVLYELLTGDPPFTGESPVAVAYQHVREDPSPPSQRNPDISAELDAVVLRSLSKNPANRYQSAAEMRSDLVRVLAGQRPQAPAVMTAAERTAVFASEPAHARPSRLRTALPENGEDDRRGLGGLLALLGVVTAGVILVVLLLFTDLLTGPQVTVPTVKGQPVAAAQNSLQRAGLEVTLERTRSPLNLKGRAVGTEPAAGTQVDRGSTVTLLVGTGPPQVVVPDVTGKPPDRARQALRDAGLRLSAGLPQQRVVQDPARVGTVVATKPPSGRQVPKGSAVTLVIGQAPEKVTVIDVVGSPVEQARSNLEGQGLEVSMTRVDSAEDEGQVIAQNPRPGSEIAVGSTVTLKVSNGSLLQMPDLTGEAPDEAEQELRELGWNGQFQIHAVPAGDEDDAGEITAQSPEPGATLRPHQTVVVQVPTDRGGNGNGEDFFGPDFPFG